LRLRAAALALRGPPASRWFAEERALTERPYSRAIRLFQQPARGSLL